MRAIRVAALTLLLVTIAIPARAGGAWIEWDSRYHVVGERVRVWEVVYAREVADVLAEGPFFVYIGPETWAWQRPRDPEERMARVAEITFRPAPQGMRHEGLRLGPGYYIAEAVFAMPPMASGRHLVMFCNPGCTNTLGQDPTGGFLVAQNRTEARLARRLERVEAALSERIGTERRARRAGDQHLDDQRRRAEDEGEERLYAAEERIAALERAARRPPSFPWLAVSLAALLGAAGTGAARVVLRRRHRQAFDYELERLLDRTAV
ncbi:MAG: hypothetical protein ACRDKB_02485 [Actinomycetota bacterium]